ncbi:MAG: energy transducer TonB [Bryobacteraceae bacterium]
MRSEPEQAVSEPRLFLLGQYSAMEPPKRGLAAAGSLLVHILLGIGLVTIPLTVPAARVAHLAPEYRVVPLIAPPPAELTQKDPNKTKPALEVNLQGLLNRPTPQPQTPPRPSSTQPAAPRKFEGPPKVAAEAPKPMIEAPKLDLGSRQTGELEARNLPGVGTQTPLPPTPPQIQPEEKPKLAFERPGANMGSPNNSGIAQGRMPTPQRSSVDDAMRQVARGGGGGLVVGDIGEGVGGLGESLNNPAAPLKNASALELLSDPQGVDFKPYLIRILSSVRRNWFAVMPESARLGRRGKVLIQFAINKDGSVPKLVIAGPSGSEALDRAAVAGVSASNPFPPLPMEFKGNQVRLQFTFSYNIPK